jgi:hypothetical protein
MMEEMMNANQAKMNASMKEWEKRSNPDKWK